MTTELEDIHLQYLGERPDSDLVENVIRIMRRFNLTGFRIEKEEGAVRVATHPTLYGETQKNLGHVVLKLFADTNVDGLEIELPDNMQDADDFEVRRVGDE